MSGVGEERVGEETQRVLAGVFTLLEGWRERTQGLAPAPEQGSSLGKDDEVTHPYRVSHAVVMAQVSAVDHVEAFAALVRDAGVMPARAGFTILRSALENAATAVWLLAPGSRSERVMRRLRLQWADIEDEMRLLTLASVTPDRSRDERKSELQVLARTRGLSHDQISHIASTKVSYSSIVKTAGDRTPGLSGDWVLAAWMAASGIAHARTWAALYFLDKITLPTVTPGVTGLRLSASDEWIVILATMTARILDESWRLLNQRRLAYT